MIHFDFVLSDVDAENLMSLFGTAIGNDNNQIMKEMVKDDHDVDIIKAYKRDIEYLKELKLKMSNTRVAENEIIAE